MLVKTICLCEMKKQRGQAVLFQRAGEAQPAGCRLKASGCPQEGPHDGLVFLRATVQVEQAATWLHSFRYRCADRGCVVYSSSSALQAFIADVRLFGQHVKACP